MPDDILVVLASRSPRRRQLLAEAGYKAVAIQSGLDDGLLRMGQVEPTQWVSALAFLKAEAGRRHIAEQTDSAELVADHPADRTVILGADTSVICDDRVIGQPRDETDARRILEALSDRSHAVITGVALVDLEAERRRLFCDCAYVDVGTITDAMIDEYLQSGGWRGKAGAYNLRERLEAGWPITFEGDPTTIMGLPMRMMADQLSCFCS
jgi:septum formation protein